MSVIAVVIRLRPEPHDQNVSPSCQRAYFRLAGPNSARSPQVFGTLNLNAGQWSCFHAGARMRLRLAATIIVALIGKLNAV
jgi:hypothetical protein